MSQYKELFNQGKLAAFKRKRIKHFPGVSREELDKAMSDYLERGGKIKRVEPEWIEEGEINIIR